MMHDFENRENTSHGEAHPCMDRPPSTLQMMVERIGHQSQKLEQVTSDLKAVLAPISHGDPRSKRETSGNDKIDARCGMAATLNTVFEHFEESLFTLRELMQSLDL